MPYLSGGGLIRHHNGHVIITHRGPCRFRHHRVSVGNCPVMAPFDTKYALVGARHIIIANAGSEAYANARRLGSTAPEARAEAAAVQDFIRRIME
jgi:hypothetical protein